ncbi:hypothetical protein CDES_09255 [Corynebacterium deserti GIMN1.010]|uniref:Uncharacterized protein n=1 Tax=Corynebacterium deserti GIMN1.010 TaxID=931089 RepID=A0A0M3Q9V4_9CORY|nr:hypothetical protein CDES_09255 [Corynebacterium deserti GIMN1.010]
MLLPRSYGDHMAVFFSVLEALILLGLYVRFLGKLQIEALPPKFHRRLKKSL